MKQESGLDMLHMCRTLTPWRRLDQAVVRRPSLPLTAADEAQLEVLRETASHRKALARIVTPGLPGRSRCPRKRVAPRRVRGGARSSSAVGRGWGYEQLANSTQLTTHPSTPVSGAGSQPGPPISEPTAPGTHLPGATGGIRRGSLRFVVVSNNARNRALPSVLAVRLTTRPKPVLSSIVGSHRMRCCLDVPCDDVYELWDDEVRQDVGALSPATIRAIGEGLQAALGL